LGPFFVTFVTAGYFGGGPRVWVGLLLLMTWQGEREVWEVWWCGLAGVGAGVVVVRRSFVHVASKKTLVTVKKRNK
jgi:hypothetical protein